ncbi:MAG: two-component sensor histidine kinase, partial [Desulfovibrio sp.]|nr:two-component sensor histidine kinase [Desulfovibrio sp.]
MQAKHDNVLSFGVVRSLALAAMTLTVILSVVVAIYLGNYSGNTIIRKNHSFASLLADYLNNQIYRRFTLPTVGIFGRIDLNNPEQYRALDGIIRSIIQGLNVDDLRIFSHDQTVRYATNQNELGSKEYAGPSVAAAILAAGPIFEIIESIPYWQAFFRLSLDPDTFRMRTTYPLRIENHPSSTVSGGALMGVLEFSQDITLDMKSTIRFQQLVLAVTLLSSGMLLLILMILVRRAERALALRVAAEQSLQAELHQHEKLAGMGRVVASIAHEIRNPLGIISSSAELLLRRTDGASPGTAKILQAIYDEAKRLTRTVGDFLDYARPRQPKPDAVDVNAVINQALTFLAPDLAQRDIGVVRAGELDAPLWVSGDKDLLYRAFYNIMGNAVQAVGSAGTLTIRIQRVQGSPPAVSLLFHDSGPGFPVENMDQLLDPFFTTKDDGTGLGLAIVNTIIASHGGALTLANGPDGGAEVLVTLPGA